MKKVSLKQMKELAKKLNVPLASIKSTYEYVKKNQDDFLQPGMKGYYEKWGRQQNAQAKRKKENHPIVQKMVNKEKYAKAKKIDVEK